MQATHRVFVYGTLMRGEHHHGVLRDAGLIGAATTQPAFTLMWMEYYPALLDGGGQAVRGEVYGVDDVTLKALDVLEEHPEVYTRRLIELADGSCAFAYVLRPEQLVGGVAIPSGDFRDVPARQRRP